MCENFFDQLKTEMYYGREWSEETLNSVIRREILTSGGITNEILNFLRGLVSTTG